LETLGLIVNLLYQYADNIAILTLSAIGLIIIFGMMGVINMAHGEMMMIGAYITSFSYYAGLPAPLAVVLGGLGAGLAGIVLERLVIRRFYGQLLASLVATWGLSLILSQGALLAFGPLIRSVPTPFGSFAVGEYSYSYYRLFLFAVGLGFVCGLWLLLNFTRFGVRARATMENPRMANALGIDVARIYSLSFGLGTMLAGLAGGLLALTASIGPFYGQSYTPMAFVTVVVGGAAEIVVGLMASVLSLGLVKTLFTSQFNILIGHVAMLVVAFVIIRIMPSGISEWIGSRQIRVRGR
jgi:branched-chain amino acid transport system permease protein